MTPERWCQIDELFDAALQVHPRDRENWLRGACGSDEDMLNRLRLLLKQDARAERMGFLEPPAVPYYSRDSTASLPSGPRA
jgi:hypothetical protein